MLLSWLVPDTSYLDRLEGWTARTYLPRHCRPPALIRLASSAMAPKGGLGLAKGLGPVSAAVPDRVPRTS